MGDQRYGPEGRYIDIPDLFGVVEACEVCTIDERHEAHNETARALGMRTVGEIQEALRMFVEVGPSVRARTVRSNVVAWIARRLDLELESGPTVRSGDTPVSL